MCFGQECEVCEEYSIIFYRFTLRDNSFVIRICKWIFKWIRNNFICEVLACSIFSFSFFSSRFSICIIPLHIRSTIERGPKHAKCMVSCPYPILFECANGYANECTNEYAKTSHSSQGSKFWHFFSFSSASKEFLSIWINFPHLSHQFSKFHSVVLTYSPKDLGHFP